MGSIINILQQHHHHQHPVTTKGGNKGSAPFSFSEERVLDAFAPRSQDSNFTGDYRHYQTNSKKGENNASSSSAAVTTSTVTSYFFNWRSQENLPMDFCKNSSLHGLKYIGERRQHVVERMFWTVAFTIGLVVACIMISDVWKKYKSNSVITTFAPYETKIEELPFPAVTICNMNKVLKSKAIQIMNEAKGTTDSDKRSTALENLYYLNHVCSTSRSFTKMFNYSSERGRIDRKILENANMNEDSYDGGKKDLWKFFQAASPLCRDMILKCIWQKEVRNCSELFTPLETDNGKCCTFNMVPPSILHRFNMTGMKEDPSVTKHWEWDGEGIVKSRKNEERLSDYPDFPRRQKIPGQSFGLSILLNPGLEEYFCTSSDSHGFRMTAHLPIDVPHISDFGLAIKPNSEVFVNIRPEVTIADKDTIGSFPAEQRECYFNGERDLGYYNFYTAKNCIDECLANLTYQECSCRRHYQPGEDSKPLCGPKEFHCASNIKRKFVGTYKTRCRTCLPTCNEIQYHTETTYTPLQSSNVLWQDHEGNTAQWAGKNVSIVHIFFGEDSTNAKLRKELYGVIDLIANFGGLMGLCLGFSGLSLVELIYFLTLRAWCRIRRNKRQNKQGNGDGGGGGGRLPVVVTSRKKSLKRTETTTELIDYEEENENTMIEEDDGGFLEMRTMARGMVGGGGTRSGGCSSSSTSSTKTMGGGGNIANGISIISKGPAMETRRAIEAILQSVLSRNKNRDKVNNDDTIIRMNGVNCNYSVTESGAGGNNSNSSLTGEQMMTCSTIINMTPIAESDAMIMEPQQLNNVKKVYPPLTL